MMLRATPGIAPVISIRTGKDLTPLQVQRAIEQQQKGGTR